MNEEIHDKLNELKELLIKDMPKETVSVSIFYNYQGTQVDITTKTPKELKLEGVSMRNLGGDWIK